MKFVTAIVDNVLTYMYVVYAKFGDDRLWNEKALADRKSDNNNTKKEQQEQQQEQRWWPLGTIGDH